LRWGVFGSGINCQFLPTDLTFHDKDSLFLKRTTCFERIVRLAEVKPELQLKVELV